MLNVPSNKTYDTAPNKMSKREREERRVGIRDVCGLKKASARHTIKGVLDRNTMNVSTFEY